MTKRHNTNRCGLNHFDDFGSFIRAVNEIGYFSQYLRTATPAGGEDISALDCTAITGFAEYVAALVLRDTKRSLVREYGLTAT